MKPALSLVPTADRYAELLSMLSVRRPAWSKTERGFIKRFIEPLEVSKDTLGNLYKRVGTSPVLWSCHTDTVHHQGGVQALNVMGDWVTANDKGSNCLGADCTAGVWLMVEMIRAGVEGLYIFHRAEEIGGVGSSYIAKHSPELLSGIKYAIAFDRSGTASIITHQSGGRCCSDLFALSLGVALGMGHEADSGGSFTDTANYTDLIGECTNLSVGYQREHTARESLDMGYLWTLRNALLSIDVSKLVHERKPGEVDPADLWDDEPAGFEYVDPWDQEPRGKSINTMASLVRDHPDEVADWLEEYGITIEELESAIYMRGGYVRRRS